MLVQLHHLIIVGRVHILQVGLVVETGPSALVVVVRLVPWLVLFLSGPLPLVHRLFFKTSPPSFVGVGMLGVVWKAVHIIGGIVI